MSDPEEKLAVCDVGAHTYGEITVLRYGHTDRKVSVGRYCSVAEFVTVMLGGNHRHDWVTTYPFTGMHETYPEVAHVEGHPRSKGDVRIGNDVWLGRCCVILSGVTIGDGAVVGAYALVTRDVPPYAIVGGNPAEVIRYRFSREHIDRLLKVAWWNQPDEAVRKLIPLLVSNDIGAFLRAAEGVQV